MTYALPKFFFVVKTVFFGKTACNCVDMCYTISAVMQQLTNSHDTKLAENMQWYIWYTLLCIINAVIQAGTHASQQKWL